MSDVQMRVSPFQTKPSRLQVLPDLIAICILPCLMIVSQWNPCDTVHASAHGDSIFTITLSIALAVLTSIGSIALHSSQAKDSHDNLKVGRLSRFMACCGLLFVAWLFIVTLLTIGNSNVRFSINGFWQWTSLILVAFSTERLVRRQAIAGSLLTLSLAISAGIVAYALYQYYFIMPAQRQEFDQNSIAVLNKQGIMPNSAGALLFANRIKSTEPTGPFVLANSLAGYLCTYLLIIACYVIDWLLSKRALETHKRQTSIAGVAFLVVIGLLAGVVLLLTKSRTAWIAFLAGIVGVLFCHPAVRFNAMDWLKQKKLVVLSTLALIAFIAIGIYWSDPLILSEATKSLSYRFDYWQGAAQLITHRPVSGYGAFNFQSSYLLVKSATAAESPADPHNFLFEAGHAGGVPLMILSLASIVGLAIRWLALLHTRAESKSNNDRQPLLRTTKFCFWAASILSAIGLLLFNLFFSGDEILIASIVATLFAVSSTVFALRIKSLNCWFESSLMKPSQCNYLLSICIGCAMLHLSASGGWMLQGVMMSPIILIAVICASEPPSVRLSTSQTRAVARGRLYDWGMLLATISCAVGFGLSMFLPTSRGLEASTMLASLPAGQLTIDNIEVLGNSDTTDSDLARLALDTCVRNLERPLSKSTRQTWIEASERWIKELLLRDPHHALAYAEAGRALLKIASSETDVAAKKTQLQQATELLSNASNLYPASAEMAVQAAVVEALFGEQLKAEVLIQKAKHIDEVTPHLDRKLKAVQVFLPERLEFPDRRLAPEARKGAPPDWIWGEPSVNWVRSQSE